MHHRKIAAAWVHSFSPIERRKLSCRDSQYPDVNMTANTPTSGTANNSGKHGSIRASFLGSSVRSPVCSILDHLLVFLVGDAPAPRRAVKILDI